MNDENQSLNLERASDAARRTAESAREAQEKFITLMSEKPVIRRFSREYIRGATEFFFAAVGVGAVAYALRCGLVRYRMETDIPTRLVRRRATLHGYVMRVTDGDGLRFYHTPWLRRLMFPNMRRLRKISSETINVRLAGVDAPETAHYGAPGQKFGQEAKTWLKNIAEYKRASLKIHRLDQYNRVLGTVHVKRENSVLRFLGLGRRNISLELTKAGYAEVYKGVNAEYGGQLKRLQKAQATAMRQRLGMWRDKNILSPAEYKARLREGYFLKNDTSGGHNATRKPGDKPRASAIMLLNPFSVVNSVHALIRRVFRPSGDGQRAKSTL